MRAAWVFFLALATLQAERGAPGANIDTFGDAIWWAIVTIATVGYGDLYPVTPAGRFYAVLLMAGGIAIVGTASATIISYLNERVAGLRHQRATRSGRAVALDGRGSPTHRPLPRCRPPKPVADAEPGGHPTGAPGSLSG